MNELVVADRAAEWRRLKALVLDSVSSPITRRVYNLGLDEFFAWYAQESRPGFTKAIVSAWRVALEARRLGAVSINVRITAVRKLAVEAADNGLLAPELATGITRVKGVAAKGIRLGNYSTIPPMPDGSPRPLLMQSTFAAASRRSFKPDFPCRVLAWERRSGVLTPCLPPARFNSNGAIHNNRRKTCLACLDRKSINTR
jgi:hypothetical protein